MTTPGQVIVPAPVVQPYRYGLLSAVQTPPPADPHWPTGVMHDQQGLAQAQSHAGWCGTPIIGTGRTGDPWISGAVVTVDAVWDCSLPGHGEDDLETRTRQRLDFAAPRALERAFWTGKDQAGAALDKSLFGATVLDATARRVDLAVGLLEQWLNEQYGGQGVIHAPREAAAKMHSDITVTVAQHKETSLANYVAFGAGYNGTSPAGVVPTVGQVWLYATAAIAMYQGADLVSPQPNGFDRATNRQLVIAERQYGLFWEGGAAAVLADLTL